MPFPAPERRMRTRYKVRVPFVLKSGEQEQTRGMTRNISLLGISAYSDLPVSQVHPVQCVMNLPKAPRPLVAHGTVIRCEPLPKPGPDGSHEIGVFFKEFEGSGESDLLRFLQQVLRQEQAAIQAGYRALKQRVADRKKRKRLEALEKRRRKLKRRKAKLAQEKKKLARSKKRAARSRTKTR